MRAGMWVWNRFVSLEMHALRMYELQLRKFWASRRVLNVRRIERGRSLLPWAS